MSTSLVRKANYSLFIKMFLYVIAVGNIILLSIVFLYPRFSFMISHWGTSEREILLSEGSKDNPNTERLRKVYKLMYFVKENGVVYFINPRFSLAHAYKIVLPRKVHFLNSQDMKEFSLLDPKRRGMTCYFVFAKKDKPDFCKEDEVIWDESEWGIYNVSESVYPPGDEV